MEYGMLHQAGLPWLKVESKRNCYVLTVDDEEYAYYDVEELIIGIMVHALAGVRTAIDLRYLKSEVEIKTLVPSIRQQVKDLDFNVRFF